MNSLSQQYATPSQTDADRLVTPPIRRRKWRRLAMLLLCLLLLLLGVKLFRIGLAAWQGYQAATQIRQQVQGDFSLAHLPAITPSVQTLATAMKDLERETRSLQPLLAGLAHLPKYGATLAAIPEFLTIGSNLIGIASTGLTELENAIFTQPDLTLKTLLSQTLSLPPQQWQAMAQQAETAQQAMQKISATSLPESVQEEFALAKSLLPVMSSALHMAPALPALLGTDQPRTYLILVQNNHELRATGGFISAIGVMTITNGDLSGLDFQDSYDYVLPGAHYPPAPKPMQRYMNIPIMLLRDANWSPDFPTTAEMVKTLYALETGTNVAGVVSIDLYAAQLLVDALGPLAIPGVAEPMTGDGFVEQIKQFWLKPLGTNDTEKSAGFSQWWEQRKDFIQIIAKAALDQVQSNKVSYPKLAQGVLRALDERSIQIWLTDPLAAQELHNLGWDGSFSPLPDADYLALVDTNMGYNKVNAVVQRQLDYKVEWLDGPTQPAQATLQINYSHPISVANYQCTATAEYGLDYDAMISRCFFNYVRLYTPAGSKLIAIDGVEPDSTVTQRAEKKTQLFAGYFILPVGQQHSVTFRYQLPPHLTPETYQLRIQRQSGSGVLPLKISVNGVEFAENFANNTLIWKSSVAPH